MNPHFAVFGETFEQPRPAQTGPSPAVGHAAVRPVRPDFRRNRKICDGRTHTLRDFPAARRKRRCLALTSKADIESTRDLRHLKFFRQVTFPTFAR